MQVELVGVLDGHAALADDADVPESAVRHDDDGGGGWHLLVRQLRPVVRRAAQDAQDGGRHQQRDAHDRGQRHHDGRARAPSARHV